MRTLSYGQAHLHIDASKVRTIVIVGAGFCGTTLAVHLLRSWTPVPLHICLVEQTREFGRGLAYSKSDFPYLLNVAAARMSMDSKDPMQFVRFAKRRDPAASGSDFLSRELYGDYLQSMLSDAERRAHSHINLTRIRGQARQIVETSVGRARVELANGSALDADDVVIATGNPPPEEPQCAESLRGHPDYVNSPWELPVARSNWRNVFVIGTGLSMVDVALQLIDETPNAASLRVNAVSPRGLLPLAHSDDESSNATQAAIISAGMPLRSLIRDVRQHANAIAIRGGDWRELVKAMRTHAPQIWRRLTDVERARFFRHVRPFWEIHRHRLPAHIAQALIEARSRGNLRLRAGRIQSMHRVGDQIKVLWRSRGGIEASTFIADAVINATGPNYRLATTRNPLLRSLFDSGVITADRASLGIRTNSLGAVIDANNIARRNLFYLGPMLRATHWEATAVPELRIHAERLAATLINNVSAESNEDHDPEERHFQLAPSRPEFTSLGVSQL